MEANQEPGYLDWSSSLNIKGISTRKKSGNSYATLDVLVFKIKLLF